MKLDKEKENVVCIDENKSSLAKDENEKFDFIEQYKELMECRICLIRCISTEYEKTEKYFCVLDCGHSICITCAKDIYSSCNKNCPLCKVEMKSNNFNKNYHVNEIFDLLNTGLRTHIDKVVNKRLKDKDEYKLYEIEEWKKKIIGYFKLHARKKC